MTVITSILGWQAFGVAVRMWQLGLQQRPQTSVPHIYAYVLTGWGALGYGAHFYHIRIKEILVKKRAKIEAINARKEAARQQASTVIS